MSVGDYVKEGADIVNLESIDPLKVDFRVPEIYLKQVQVGQSLTVTLDALPGKTYEGKVFAINPLVDAAGRSIVIRAQVQQPRHGAAPRHVRARAAHHASDEQDALVVPEQALVPQGDEQYVFRVVDGKAVRDEGRDRPAPRRPRSRSSRASPPDDIVVTAGQLKLRDGIAGDASPARRGRGRSAAPRQGRRDGGSAPRQGATARRRTRAEVLQLRTGAPRCSCPRSASSGPCSRRCCRSSSCWSASSRTRGCRCASTRASTSRWSASSTTYRGASAEVVESQVTKPLEDSLAGIEGVEVMTSQSRSETSRINVRFTLKRDPDSAAADVRDKVARARGKLPDTIDEPIIAKVEADSQPDHLHRGRRRAR